jgi:hypothetical protein
MHSSLPVKAPAHAPSDPIPDRPTATWRDWGRAMGRAMADPGPDR